MYNNHGARSSVRMDSGSLELLMIESYVTSSAMNSADYKSSTFVTSVPRPELSKTWDP